MIINKIKYTKLGNKLYTKLNNINCINNLKYLKFKSHIKQLAFHTDPARINKCIHKPSNYIKVNYKNLIKLKNKLKSGYLILSTPLGVITDKKALCYKVGGKLLYYVNTI